MLISIFCTMNMDNMDNCLEEMKSTGIFVHFCVLMELDCLGVNANESDC